MKKIKKKIVKLVENAYWKGWGKGYDAGKLSSQTDNMGDVDDFAAGWDARGENVKIRLKMLEEGYMLEGKGAKAVMVREIAELIAIQISPEDEEEEEDDSF